MINQSHSRGQTAGLILVGLGIFFLLGQFFNFNVFSFVWPLYIILPGLALVALGISTGKGSLPITVIGSFVTMTGLILLYQAMFNHYQSWAYAWALYPVAFGAGFVVHGTAHDMPDHVYSGWRIIKAGLILFVLGWAFFELGLGISGFTLGVLGKLVGPALLIGLGVYLWRRREQPHKWM